MGGAESGWSPSSETAEVKVMQWPEIVIFDCDGLVDSEVIALEQTRKAFDAVGLQLTAAETMDRFHGMRIDTIKAEAEFGAALPIGFPTSRFQNIIASFERELKGIPGVQQAIAGLSARVCVASSSGWERIRRALSLVGYNTLFEPNIFSAVCVERGKPNPDLFLYAARQMGVAQCLVIEDSVSGVVGAAAADMIVYGFIGGSHFLESSLAIRLTDAGAETIFDEMTKLPGIVAALPLTADGGAALVHPP
jgi:HAD superfamily hydrolase (TIGR01509 family)